MPRVEFEPTISVFERAKRIHALDRADTLIGAVKYTKLNFNDTLIKADKVDEPPRD
jgi:hypothetical protein